MVLLRDRIVIPVPIFSAIDQHSGSGLDIVAVKSVPVLLFASYADSLGSSQIDVPTDQAETIAHIVGYLRSLPGGEKLPAEPVVAVNLSQVGLDYRPVPGDEVAILPPMAGG